MSSFILLRDPTQLNAVLLLICDSCMSWSTRFVVLNLCVGFSIFDSISFLKFIFLVQQIAYGLFDGGVKLRKFTSNFPKRKGFWHMTGMNIPSEKMPGYTHEGFYVTKAQYGWISHNRVSRKPHVVEKGFIVQIKRKINTLTDVELSDLKSQSYWIN